MMRMVIDVDPRKEARRLRKTVLRLSGGHCYVCNFHCPPILIVHHLRPVCSDGGSDLNNLVALCPNCHAAIHSSGADSESGHPTYALMKWLKSYLNAEQLARMQRLIRAANTYYPLWDILQGG